MISFLTVCRCVDLITPTEHGVLFNDLSNSCIWSNMLRPAGSEVISTLCTLITEVLLHLLYQRTY